MTSPVNKSPSSDNELLVRALKSELDAAAEGLDMATQSRLNQARHKVLASRPNRFNHWCINWASALALGCLTIALLNNPSGNTSTLLAVHPVNPLEMATLHTLEPAALDFVLASDEELELVEQFDLYTWLLAEYG